MQGTRRDQSCFGFLSIREISTVVGLCGKSAHYERHESCSQQKFFEVFDGCMKKRCGSKMCGVRQAGALSKLLRKRHPRTFGRSVRQSLHLSSLPLSGLETQFQKVRWKYRTHPIEP